MNRTLLLLIILISPLLIFAQNNIEQSDSDLTLYFDSGILIGHSESYYPTPFSSNISILKNVENRIWLGAGSGVQVIGKTFVPLFADFRVAPFKTKPIFFYNRTGYSFCANKSYAITEGNNNYYYHNYPHPLDEDVTTKGGFMSETGIGFLLKRGDWKTSFSLGYHYQKTYDEVTEPTPKTYENLFNRIAVRIGFWF